jgi:hypothetical protein
LVARQRNMEKQAERDAIQRQKEDEEALRK